MHNIKNTTGYKKVFCIIVFSFCSVFYLIKGQNAPQHIDNFGIYEFIDELANEGIINVNSAVKPYSRMTIAQWLSTAYDLKDNLNSRQKNELYFYLRDFGKEANIHSNGTAYDSSTKNMHKVEWPHLRSVFDKTSKRLDLFYYSDSLCSITINPIIGGEAFVNSSGKATYWHNGLEARAYIGNFAFYASLIDNHETPLISLPKYISQRRGGHIKNGTDWSDMQGGISYSWKWGDMAFKKDNFSWGNNYHGSNIFSGRNPSFIYVNLHLKPTKWFEFNYIHGWLNSMVVDSSLSFRISNSNGDDYREKYHKKFLAANMYSFTPLRQLTISAGNSIVYDDASANPAYLFPLFFYKSVDHSLTSGIDNMNSQMFIDISSRQIKNIHLYATLFIDELSVSRFTKDDEWNFFSWKAGARLSNFPVENVFVTGEFTYSYPFTFQHYLPTITFESNKFNLGHYLKDNAREWFFSLGYKPLRTLDISIYYIDIIKGPDYTSLENDRLGYPPLASIDWKKTASGLKISCQLINDFYLWLSFEHSNTSGKSNYTPALFQENKNTFNGGLTIGF